MVEQQNSFNKHVESGKRIENLVELDITDKKNHGQVDDFDIDTLLDQTESVSSPEFFTRPLFKTTIQVSVVPYMFFSKMSRSTLSF